MKILNKFKKYIFALCLTLVSVFSYSVLSDNFVKADSLGLYPVSTGSYKILSIDNNVWNIGDTYYYNVSSGGSEISLEYVFSTNNWKPKVWSIGGFNGKYIWNIGDTYYFSNGSTQLRLDVATSTWYSVSWNGFANVNGSNIWNIGDTYYYSGGSSFQFVLDTSTNTWNQMTWNGFSNVTGSNIWNIGDTYYYGNGASAQYVLDISTNTWSQMTWNGSKPSYGQDVWNIGDTYYYSSGSSNQYVLDLSTNTWSPTTWGGLFNFSGRNLWCNSFDCYTTSYDVNYVLSDGPVSSGGFTQEDLDNAYDDGYDDGWNAGADDGANNFLVPTSCTYTISDVNYDCPALILDRSVDGTIGFYHLNRYLSSTYESPMYSITLNFDFYVPTYNSVYLDFETQTGVNVSFYYNNRLVYSISNSGEFKEFISSDSLSDFGSYNKVVISNTIPTCYLYSISVLQDTSYDIGVSAGRIEGYDDGFFAGQVYGERIGYDEGYLAGVGEKNTLVGMIGAIFTGPVTMLQSIFNFNILGVNFVEMLLGLTTLLVVIWLVKRFI